MPGERPAATRGGNGGPAVFAARRPVAAAMRYIVEQKLDNRAFAASLVDAAVKGHVRLVEEDGGWFGGNERRIERLHRHDLPPLAPPERVCPTRYLDQARRW